MSQVVRISQLVNWSVIQLATWSVGHVSQLVMLVSYSVSQVAT